MSTTSTTRHLKAAPKVEPREVMRFVEDIFDDDMHKKRVLSVSHGVLGVLHGAGAAVHAIGQGLAVARGLDPKHAVKQVDRMLSNAGIRMDEAFVRWVRFVVGDRKDIVVTLDWTDHAHDKYPLHEAVSPKRAPRARMGHDGHAVASGRATAPRLAYPLHEAVTPGAA